MENTLKQHIFQKFDQS